MHAVEEGENDGTAQADADADEDDDGGPKKIKDKCDSEDVLDREPLERSEEDREGEDCLSLNGTC